MSDIIRPLVVSYGGGVNSTAMLVEMARRGIRPEVILFADTGGEKPETYAYRDILSAWLRQASMPQITAIARAFRFTTLYDECMGRRILPSLAFGLRSCSDNWKIQPQNRFLREWAPAKRAWESGAAVTKAVGFDAGEPHRIGDYDNRKYKVWLPLVEWGMDREDCRCSIKSAGLPAPIKSSCFFCPAMKKHEVLSLKRDHPCLYQRACKLEANAAPNLGVVKGLGRNWSWTALGRADEAQYRFWPEPPAIPCMCDD